MKNCDKMKEKDIKKRGRPLSSRPTQFNKKEVLENGGGNTILISDNPKEICLIKCEICQSPVKCMRGHAMRHHHLSAKEYQAFYPDVNYKRKTYHRYKY